MNLWSQFQHTQGVRVVGLLLGKQAESRIRGGVGGIFLRSRVKGQPQERVGF